MATHSSTVAWRISWTEEPGGLQSMGSQRVGHDWSNLARTHACHPHKFKWLTSLLFYEMFNVCLLPVETHKCPWTEWERGGYLQLPCEILIGSESSGKAAPAQCSSVKYSSKASDLIVVQRGDFTSLLHPAKEQRRDFYSFLFFCKSVLFHSIKSNGLEDKF